MKSENIPADIKSKSLKDTKDEINEILDKLENEKSDIKAFGKSYDRLMKLNKHVDNLFKQRVKEISSLGKKENLMASSNLNLNAKKVDNFIKAFLKRQKSSGLLVPMKYGIISGGKKIRSTLIFSTGKIFNLKKKDLIYLCSAVECIHSYSLIHDDLPCMDNDKFRRGKLSTHAKFGESTAVLAGNSLLTLAFEILSSKDFKVKPQIKIELIKNLANCSGHSGIAGGQELDLKFEKKRVSFNKTLNMQRKKQVNYFNFVALPQQFSPIRKKRKNYSCLNWERTLDFYSS